MAIKSSDIIFICVGTPSRKKNKSADLQYVFKAANEIGKFIDKFKIIVTKSTVPVSTGDKIEKIISKKKSRKMFNVENSEIGQWLKGLIDIHEDFITGKMKSERWRTIFATMR